MDKVDNALVDCFEIVLREALNNPSIVKEWNRLSNAHFLEDNRPPIVIMIDEATGYQKELDKKQQKWMSDFAAFVWVTIFVPLMNDYVKEESIKREANNTKEEV